MPSGPLQALARQTSRVAAKMLANQLQTHPMSSMAHRSVSSSTRAALPRLFTSHMPAAGSRPTTLAVRYKPTNRHSSLVSAAAMAEYSTPAAAQDSAGPAPSAGDDASMITERPWSSLVANAISLIGRTGGDVQLKHLQTGKRVASIRLAVPEVKRAGMERETSWYNVEVWDDLADNAARQLRKGTQVCVQGRIKQESYQTSTGEQRTSIKVVATHLSTIVQDQPAAGSEWGQPQAPVSGSSEWAQEQSWGQDNYSQVEPAYHAPPGPAAGGDAGPVTKDSPMAKKWEFWLNNPDRFWDNRTNKKNPRGPDFKSKDNDLNIALWLDDRTPAWVQKELARRDGFDTGMN